MQRIVSGFVFEVIVEGFDCPALFVKSVYFPWRCILQSFMYQKGRKASVVEYKEEIINGYRVLTYRDLNESASEQENYLRHMSRYSSFHFLMDQCRYKHDKSKSLRFIIVLCMQRIVSGFVFEVIVECFDCPLDCM